MRMFLLLVLLLGAAAYWFLNSDSYTDLKEDRVRSALTSNGVPDDMADCMTPKLVEGLSVFQLLKLEELGAGKGEGAVPKSVTEAIDRLQRIDDPEAVRVAVGAATTCAISSIF